MDRSNLPVMNFSTLRDIYEMVQISLGKETLTKYAITSWEGFARRLFPLDLYILCRSATYSVRDLFSASGTPKDRNVLEEYACKVNAQSRSTLNHFYNNQKAQKRYEEIAGLLLRKDPATDQYYTYADCPYRLHIRDSWDIILSEITQAEYDQLEQNLQGTIDYTTRREPTIRERFRELYDDSIASCLASLTLIASTLYYFEEQFDSPETRLLKLMLLPNNEEAAPDLNAIQKCKSGAAKQAAKLLASISDYKSLIETNETAAEQCYVKCTEILSLGFLEDPAILGEANYILYLCNRHPFYSGAGEKAAYKYLEESYRYGYPEAKALIDSADKFRLAFHASPGTSPDHGVCIVNCRNPYTKLFESTIPKGQWSVLEYGADDVEQATELCPKKYLFFSDDFRQNLADTMKLIDIIREKEAFLLTEFIEIYIRCEEEKYGPLIDTAQNYLEDHVLRIYLLDDPKFAAQYLLSRHPLFYPIRSFTPQSAKQQIPLLNFVVIGSDQTAEWLVRESFWLMTFLPNEVATKITILAPDATRLYTDIITKCPGLRRENTKVADLFKGKIINEIEVLDRSLENCEFENTVDTLYNTESYLYFAVSTGDDEKNLALSIRLREQLIRNAIISQPETADGIASARAGLHRLPPIAFQCTDPDISELGSHLVVSNIKYGNQWFNNYALIPFGGLNTRYTWDELDGGITEKYSLCVHMEYSDISPEQPLTESRQSYEHKRQEAINSYFSRQYNKDSSRAVALSLPYRLFSMYKGRNKRLVSLSWNILDSSTYYRDELPSFAKDTAAFEGLSDNSETILRLSEWEQIRWSRYMLSRGWMPVTPTQTKIYVDSDYTRHQLYIAKLHPAICDFERLKKVEQELGRSFREYNIRNLKHTDRILEMAWLTQEREIKEPSLELE